MRRTPTARFSGYFGHIHRACHVARCTLIVFLLVSPVRAETHPLINTLGPEDGESRDDFGNSIAVDNGVAIIGADWKENNRGAVYLMDIATGGTLRKVTAADTEAGDQFGFEVAIGGNAAVVGAPWQSNVGTESGAAYVFDVDSGDERFKLMSEDLNALDAFGFSVDVIGDTAIVGAPFVNGRGAAYVFDAATGDQIHKLSATHGVAGDEFGYSVALDGPKAIVGAHLDDQIGPDVGAAYIFDVATGQQLTKLTPSDGKPADEFGFSVAVDGNIALVGAPVAADDNDVFSGAAYLFDVNTGDQLLRLNLEDGAEGDSFGYSVALDGNLAIVGAPGDDQRGEDAGAAYVLDIATGRQLAKLTSEAGQAADFMGWSVDVQDAQASIGIPTGDYDGVRSGLAQVYDVSYEPPALQAGDADADLDFDQLDLVKVQIAGTYLTGQAATWGDGDWNGAPGGTPGNPPRGDGVFDQLDIVAAQIAGLYRTGPYAGATSDAGPAHVPEPSTATLVLIALLGTLVHRNRGWPPGPRDGGGGRAGRQMAYRAPPYPRPLGLLSWRRPVTMEAD